MNRVRYISISIPEGYEDVHPQLILEDFIGCPKNPVWEAEDVTDFVEGLWNDSEERARHPNE